MIRKHNEHFLEFEKTTGGGTIELDVKECAILEVSSEGPFLVTIKDHEGKVFRRAFGKTGVDSSTYPEPFTGRIHIQNLSIDRQDFYIRCVTYDEVYFDDGDL